LTDNKTKQKKELKQTNISAHLTQSKSCGSSPTGTMQKYSGGKDL